jgi:hypothetical protein
MPLGTACEHTRTYLTYYHNGGLLPVFCQRGEGAARRIGKIVRASADGLTHRQLVFHNKNAQPKSWAF